MHNNRAARRREHLRHRLTGLKVGQVWQLAVPLATALLAGGLVSGNAGSADTLPVEGDGCGTRLRHGLRLLKAQVSG